MKVKKDEFEGAIDKMLRAPVLPLSKIGPPKKKSGAKPKKRAR